MRQRSRDDTSRYLPSVATVYITNFNGSQTTGIDSLAAPANWMVGIKETMLDIVTPRYQQRSANGDIIVNPMEKRKDERRITCETRTYTLTNGSGQVYTARTPQSPGGLNTVMYPVEHMFEHVSNEGNLKKLAGTQAHANVDGPTFAGAVFIGELRETIGFLRSPISGWNKFLSGLRNPARQARARSIGHFLRDNWLGYRYAVRPLMHDIASACKAIDEVVSNHKPTRHTARGSGSGDQTRQTDTIVNGYQGVGTWSVSTKTTCQTRCKSGVIYEMSRSRDTFGVGLAQLPITAWELVPYSFVVDWFANIGPYIEAITPKLGVSQLGSWTTTESDVTTQRITRWVTGGNSGSTPRVITSDGRTTEDYSSVIKTRSSGAKIGLATPFAPLSGDIGKARVLDLLALSSQLLSKRP